MNWNADTQAMSPISYWPGTLWVRRHRRLWLAGWSPRRRLVALLAAAVLLFTALQLVWGPAAPARAADLPSPTRAMFYYPWFPETWHTNDHYRPALGQYTSDNPTVVAAHVAAMRDAGMQAVIASWWGRGQHNEQTRFPQLYTAAGVQGLSVIPYYEPEGQGDVPIAQIQADLTYLKTYNDTYRAGARIGGKPVIFVYNAGSTGCGEVTKWKTATAGFTSWYVNMKVFPGFASCPDQPSSWHQYGPAVAESVHLPYSFNISPGFWHHNETSPRLARDPNRWATNVSRMLGSGARWQLVTSFNEWGESTSVEPSPNWQSLTGWGSYLDELHRQIFGDQPVPSPTGSPTPSPSSTTGLPIPSPTIGPTGSPTSTPTTSSPPSPSPTVTMPPPSPGPTFPPGSVTVAAAGDIACQRPCTGQDNYTAALIGRYNPTAVLTLGDNQYEQGSLTQYQAGYATTWGTQLARTYPAPGNHEWGTTNAQGYRDYFGPRLGQVGSDTASPSQMYYSYDLGGWHFISLDSDCSQIGGCSSISQPMVAWLLTDLAANNGRPTLIYHHHPRWSSGDHGSTGSLAFLHGLLVADHDVQLVLSGHDHWYERFNPMGTTGPDPAGVRYFTVGTGGKNFTCGTTILPGSAVHQCTTMGILHLTLTAAGYSWAFRSVAEVGGPSSSFTDTGTAPLRS